MPVNPAIKPALLKGATGTLTFRPPEGPPEASPTPTVTIYDENGEVTSISGSTATISGDLLTVSVTSTILDAVGDNYRALWSYTVNGTAYQRNQLFECRLAVFYNPLSHDRFVGTYAVLLRDRYARGQASYQPQIDEAFATIQMWIRKAQRNPNHVIDPRPFERPIAELAASYVAQDRKFGSSQTDDVQAWAAEMWNRAEESFATAMANVDWIDIEEDLLPSSGEENYNANRARISR